MVRQAIFLVAILLAGCASILFIQAEHERHLH